MECGSGGGLNEFEKRREDEDHHHHKQETDVEEPPVADTDRSMVEAETTTFLAKREKVDDQLETTKSQMDEVREENEHLKIRLKKIMNEYRALEVQFHDMAKQARKKNVDNKGIDENHQEIIEEPDLVSLSLGRVPSNLRNDEKIKVSKPLVNGEFKEELALGLDCKFETSKSGSTAEGLPNPSPVNSFEGPKEEAEETLTPCKAPKTMRDTDDEVAQEIPTKKTRVCVRARCDTLTMNDGCQWRKYGQKIAKGNPCPRAYYRCTVAPSCPVRKQVQRCVEDMSILITTYEGTHNHTLPLSATAMASTTSAAASMLLSGSSTSQSGSTFANNNNNNNSNLHGLNFYLSDGSKTNQLYLSNPALSSSQSHPTITLDLTASNHHQGSSSSSLSPFVRFASTQPRYPSSTSLSFSSPESNIMSWNNNNSNSSTFLNYNNTRQPYSHNRNNINLSTLNFGRPETMENIYQSYMQKNINTTDQTSVSAATKAITADPTFQSALAAALSSFINGGVGSINNNNNTQLGVGEKQDLGQKMKWAEMFSAAAASNSISTTLLPSTSKVVNNIGCASSSLSLLNKMPAGNTTVLQTTGSLMLLPPPSLPLSTAKSASASPRDNNSSDDTN